MLLQSGVDTSKQYLITSGYDWESMGIRAVLIPSPSDIDMCDHGGQGHDMRKPSIPVRTYVHNILHTDTHIDIRWLQNTDCMSSRYLAHMFARCMGLWLSPCIKLVFQSEQRRNHDLDKPFSGSPSTPHLPNTQQTESKAPECPYNRSSGPPRPKLSVNGTNAVSPVLDVTPNTNPYVSCSTPFTLDTCIYIDSDSLEAATSAHPASAWKWQMNRSWPACTCIQDGKHVLYHQTLANEDVYRSNQ